MTEVEDIGIDGRAILATKPDVHDSRLARAQVKGGKFNLSALRDFTEVTNQDKAALGCYLTVDHSGTPASKVAMSKADKLRAKCNTLHLRAGM